MSEIPALGPSLPNTPGPTQVDRTKSLGASPARESQIDRVELSATAADESPPTFSPEVERYIAEIRRSIADGTYLTTEKIDAVVERLFEELCGRQK